MKVYPHLKSNVYLSTSHLSFVGVLGQEFERNGFMFNSVVGFHLKQLLFLSNVVNLSAFYTFEREYFYRNVKINILMCFFATKHI